MHVGKYTYMHIYICIIPNICNVYISKVYFVNKLNSDLFSMKE